MTRLQLKQLEKRALNLKPESKGICIDMLSIPPEGMKWKKIADYGPKVFPAGRMVSIEEIMAPCAEYKLVPEDIENGIPQ